MEIEIANGARLYALPDIYKGSYCGQVNELQKSLH